MYKIKWSLSFSDKYPRLHITGEVYAGGILEQCGRIHDILKRVFPEYAYLLPWHLSNSDGPLHYLHNAKYYADTSNLEAARECAVWPCATIEQLSDVNILKSRLPGLRRRLHSIITDDLGFMW